MQGEGVAKRDQIGSPDAIFVCFVNFLSLEDSDKVVERLLVCDAIDDDYALFRPDRDALERCICVNGECVLCCEVFEASGERAVLCIKIAHVGDNGIRKSYLSGSANIPCLGGNVCLGGGEVDWGETRKRAKTSHERRCRKFVKIYDIVTRN